MSAPPLRLPRVYPILDTASLARLQVDPVSAASALIEAGARILQYRHKGHFTRSHFDEASRIAALCRDAGAMLVMNDRADVARLLGAALH